MRKNPLPSLSESMGIRPFGERFRQAVVALRGAEHVPPSKFGLSSLVLLNPRSSIPLWMGRFRIPRRVLLTNLYNHRQTPIEDGWSTKRTQMQDFRGRTLTYDSHNGTDLSVPRGTVALAPASGVVVRVHSEFNRGGLKVTIDHGEGLITCSAHLARSLVKEGDRLSVGEPYAITGYSGLDGFSTFPWGVPHIHFNVWLNGESIDPFSVGEEASLWHGGSPQPIPQHTPNQPIPAVNYDAELVKAAIGSCKVGDTREWLNGIECEDRRAACLIAEMLYYPTRFTKSPRVQKADFPRGPRLYLPFSEQDFDGVVFADEI
jgi:murein DD-endopeptidase MepM/ murein hydrolase activator NlpD